MERLSESCSIACRLPEGPKPAACGLTLNGFSRFEESFYPLIIEARNKGNLVAVHRLNSPGSFNISFSLHLLPARVDLPVRLTIQPLQHIPKKGGSWNISSVEAFLVEDRPAQTAAELLSSPDVSWYPKEIPELLENQEKRGVKAASDLARSQDRRGVRALVNALKKHRHRHIYQALEVMGNMAAPELIKLYYDFMNKGDPNRAIGVIKTIRASPSAKGFYKSLLKNKNRRIAVIAGGSLSMMGDDSGVPIAVENLKSHDPSVRADACWAIGKSHDETARKLACAVALAELNSGGYAKYQAQHALSNLPFRENVPLYLKWLKSKDPVERIHGVLGIRRIGDSSLTPSVIEAIQKEEDFETCFAFISYISPMQVSESSHELVEMLSQKNDEVLRITLIHRLREAQPEILPELREYASSENLSLEEKEALAKTINELEKRTAKSL